MTRRAMAPGLRLVMLLALLAVALAPTPARQAMAETGNVVQNGDFEEGPPIPPSPGWVNLGAGSTALPGWKIAFGTIDILGPTWQAAEGSRAIDMNGHDRGVIEQYVTTTPGQEYTVAFALAGNPECGPALKTLTTLGGDKKSSHSFDTTGRTISNLGWTERSFTFVAGSTSSRILFDSSTRGTACGPMIDNVRVTGDTGASDTIAPQTKATLLPKPGPSGWHRGTVTVTLSATDDASGVNAITYALSGAHTGGKTIAGDRIDIGLTTEGKTTVSYYAVDNAGNKEAPLTLTVNIDSTPPDTIAKVSPPADGTIVVQLLASDALSGVDRTLHRVDAASPSDPWVDGPTITLDATTTHTVEFFSIDHAGNKELPQTITTKAQPTYGVPQVTSVTPSTLVAGAGDAPITVSGVGFAPNATVTVPGGPVGIVGRTPTTIDVIVPGALIAGPLTDPITLSLLVTNPPPGGGTSNVYPLTVVPPTVKEAKSEVIPPGSPKEVALPPKVAGESGVTAKVESKDGVTLTVTVAAYKENPRPRKPGYEGGYTDLKVDGATPETTVETKFYFPSTTPQQQLTKLMLKYWHEQEQRWKAAKTSGGKKPTRQPVPDEDGSKSGGNFKIKFDKTSKPRSDQLKGTVFVFTVDDTAPEITAEVTGTQGLGDWYVSDVTVVWTVTDDSDEILDQTGCEQASITADTAGTTLTCAAESNGGWTTGELIIKRDTTPPTVTFDAPSGLAGLAGWFRGDVTIPYVVSDDASGVATPNPASGALVLTAEGTSVGGSVIATDAAGNSATVPSPAVKIDKTPPSATATRTPDANAAGWNNGDVTVSFTCADSLSDIASCVGDAALAGEGSGQSVTGTATDKAGNTASATVSDINIDKTPPTVSVQGSTVLNEGDTGMWQADAQDNLSSVAGIAWDLDNDGSFADASGPSSSRTFDDDAALPVRARVTDQAGNSADGALAVVAYNVAPTADAGPAQTTKEEVAIAFSGAATDPGTADTHTFVWDFGDGSPTATGATVGHAYAIYGTYTVTLTVTDDDGGVDTATATVTAEPNLALIARYVALSSELTWLGNGVRVLTGSVGTSASGDDERGPGRGGDDDDDDDRERGPGRGGDDDDGDDDDEDNDERGATRDRQAEVIIGQRVAILEAFSRIVGDTVQLLNGAEVFDVFFNELSKHRRATVHHNAFEGVGLPVLSMPALPAITPGTQDVEVRRNQTVTLTPGAYRRVTVQQGGTLVLEGGYDLASLDVRTQGKVHFGGQSAVRLKNEMTTDSRAYVGPDPAASGLEASDIVFYVEGGDDRRTRGEDDDRDEENGPTVVQIGVRNRVVANIYAPNGTVSLNNDTTATGAFIGKRVRIGSDVELRLDSAF